MAKDAGRLIGGYSTGNLTPEEQRELLRAALDEQRVFDALIEEDALRDALEDRRVRAELLEVLSRPTEERAWWSSLLTGRSLLAAASLAAVVTVTLVVRHYMSPDQPPVTATGPVAPAPAPSTGSTGVQATPGRSFDRWLAHAEVNPDQGVFPIPPSMAPAGVSQSAGPVPTEFVSDRRGQVAVYGVGDDSTSRLLNNWTHVESGDAIKLPTPSPGLRELRVVIVADDVQIGRDEDVIAALERGRGSVFRLELPRR